MAIQVSNSNIQVITSAVHILHSLFVNRKDIRGMVLSSSIQNIINRYLESYTTENVEDQTEYRIRIRKPYEDLGEIAIIFLANLALNEHVQNIVERLQHSMEITDFDPLQYGKNGTRYPIAFPPHPTRLSVEVEGLWLDDNKTRFFITRFKRVDPIDDHTIDVNQDHINTVPKDNEKNPIPREKSKNKNEHINTQKPPSRVNGEYRKRSDVESGNIHSMNLLPIQWKLIPIFNPIPINQKMLRHHLMHHMEMRNQRSKSQKLQINRLQEMNVLTFSILLNHFKHWR